MANTAAFAINLLVVGQSPLMGITARAVQTDSIPGRIRVISTLRGTNTLVI